MKWNKKCKFDPETEKIRCCWTDKMGQTICEEREDILTGKKSRKNVALIMALVLILFAVPYLIAVIPSFFDMGINPSSVYMYSQNNRITYRYRDIGINSPTENLVVDITPNGDYSEVKIWINGLNATFEVNVIDGTVKGTNKNTIFWFFCETSLGVFGDSFEDQYDVIDPAGILGSTNSNYTVIIGEKTIWWSEEPSVLGGQASVEVAFYDESDKKIADGLIDITSGILETVEGTIDMTLVNPGSFPMSRHRLTSFWWMVGFVVGAPIVAWIIMRAGKFLHDETTKVVILVSMASTATFLDLYLDIWFYAYIGVINLLFIHFFAMCIFSGLALQMRIRPSWVILPMGVEIGVAIVASLLGFFLYVPFLVFGLGTFMAFMCIVFRSAIGKNNLEDKFCLV